MPTSRTQHDVSVLVKYQANTKGIMTAATYVGRMGNHVVLCQQRDMLPDPLVDGALLLLPTLPCWLLVKTLGARYACHHPFATWSAYEPRRV